jgi:hypothetical protein
LAAHVGFRSGASEMKTLEEHERRKKWAAMYSALRRQEDARLRVPASFTMN